MEDEKLTEELNEEDIDLEEELDTDTEEVDSDGEVEFDYDDDGNVIIPEDAEEEVTEEAETDTEEKTEEADGAKEEGQDDKAKEAEVVEPAAAPNDKDIEIAKLKKQLNERDSVIRDTLKSLGADENDGVEGLEKLAAEAEDKTLEEYRKERAARNEQEEAVRILQKQKFEEKIRADLAAVQTAYPEAKQYKSVYEFPNFAEFSKYRDLGLSPEKAYIAANPQSVMTKVADAAVQQARNLSGTKDHLRSNVPVGSKDKSITISKKQMAEYKELFPNMSDKDIVALYKRTNKK